MTENFIRIEIDKILVFKENCLYLQPVREEISLKYKTYCGMEQLAARWAHNPKVVGSSPAPATKKVGF
jgi:hypothetical protein